MLRWKELLMLFAIAVYLLPLGGCSQRNEETFVSGESADVLTDSSYPTFSELRENRRIYQEDQAGSVVNLYITVLKNDNPNKPSYTLDELNQMDKEESLAKDSQVQVIVQEGLSQGPERGYYGYGETLANATFQLRGSSTRNAPQKSYKIKLYDGAGLWRNQEVINLNKHPYDFTRVRNKLSFDYLQLIPNMTSLRTQFFHLYVKELAASPSEGSFMDYGLYTHIEQPNKRFLRSHGLDPNGQLYKAINFEFHRYAGQLREASDPQYSKQEFEQILTIDGNNDHRKLLTMLEDVNNFSLNFNDVFAKHFNRENYLTWTAINILFGNIDSNSQNFYLFSPLNSETWYFFPWDYDGAWGYNEQQGDIEGRIPQWQSGIANYWGSILHKRFYKDPENVRALSDKIEELTKIINAKQTSAFLDAYYKVVSPLVKRPPDRSFLPLRVEEYDKYYRSLAAETEQNRQKFYIELERPMPIFLGVPKQDAQGIAFNWEHSYDLQGDDLVYELQISMDPDFAVIPYRTEALHSTECRIVPLSRGLWYWRVLVRDAKGNQQIPFDTYRDHEGNRFFGVKQMRVE